MRGRKEIEEDGTPKHLGAGIVVGVKTKSEELMLEILLDIREMLKFHIKPPHDL